MHNLNSRLQTTSYNTNFLTLLQSSLRHVVFWLGIASRVPSFKGVLVAHWVLRNWNWGLARELWRVIVALCRKVHLLLDLVLDVVLSHLRSLDGILENGVCLTPLKIFRLDFGSFIPFLNWDLVWLRWLWARELGRDRVVNDWDFLTPVKCVRFVSDTVARCFREVVANRDVLVIYCTVGNGSSNSLSLLAEL